MAVSKAGPYVGDGDTQLFLADLSLNASKQLIWCFSGAISRTYLSTPELLRWTDAHQMPGFRRKQIERPIDDAGIANDIGLNYRLFYLVIEAIVTLTDAELRTRRSKPPSSSTKVFSFEILVVVSLTSITMVLNTCGFECWFHSVTPRRPVMPTIYPLSASISASLRPYLRWRRLQLPFSLY